jgi:hypothetical protein
MNKATEALDSTRSSCTPRVCLKMVVLVTGAGSGGGAREEGGRWASFIPRYSRFVDGVTKFQYSPIWNRIRGSWLLLRLIANYYI